MVKKNKTKKWVNFLKDIWPLLLILLLIYLLIFLLTK